MMPGRVYRIAIYSPDRARYYDGRTRERDGIGGGITARLSMGEALASLGHNVTAYVHCESPVSHGGVRYVPVESTSSIDCDVLVAISTTGSPSFAPMRKLNIRAGLRLIWVQGAPKVEDTEAVEAHFVYAASNFLRRVCVERWRVPEKKLFVCYNGIHPEYFQGQLAPDRDPHAIAYVGPPEKGLTACVEVLRRLRQRNDRFRLDVFGGAELWGQTTPAFDEPGLTFMGLMGQRQLASALRGYEYCLALQTMAEGFGIAVQEAKRAGCVVIASAVGALPELIRDRVDGYLIQEPHSSAAAQDKAAALIAALADDPIRRRRIRQRGEMTPWNWRLAAESWIAHWSHVFPAAGASPQTAGLILDLPDGRHRTTDGAYAPAVNVYPHSPVKERLGLAPAKRVVIGGYYGHGNLGDEAVLAVLVDQLSAARPDVLPVVLSGDPGRTSRAHDVDAVDEQDLTSISDAIRNCELVILGGGGLLHDLHGLDENTLLRRGHWGLTLHAALPVLAARHEKPFALAAIGAGPLSSVVAQQYARAIASRARVITVRDQTSHKLLESLGIDRQRLTLTADPAFLIESAPAESAARLLSTLRVDGSRPIVAVALRDWNADGDAARRESEIARALDAIVTREEASILFVPFEATGERDRDAAAGHRVAKLLRNPQGVTHAPPGLTPAVAQSILGKCRAVIAMRMHAAILAANAGTPFVALRYKDKVTDVARLLGVEQYSFELAGLSGDALAERVFAAMSGGDAIRDMFRQRLPAIRTAARGAVAWATTPVDSHARQPAAIPEWDEIVRRADAAKSSPIVETAGGPDSTARKVVRAILPAPWRRTLRQAASARLLSPAAAIFDRYRRARVAAYGVDLRGLTSSGVPNLVSVVLPAWNGAALIREAIDSVLAQTHSSLELIIVNDGSTDDTGDIAESYARQDSRVRVIHQDNQKLPAALSRGFENAGGEYLTWTSCDNRWKPDGLARLVDFLNRQPGVELAFANLDVIGEDGRPLRGSTHYASYQHPYGSERIRLPDSTLELNIRPNNFIGAAFLYRRRMALLLGDYDRSRFVLEDYDYWMRANALMTVKHVDFDESVVEYRFHSKSLTARWRELRMFEARERLMDFDTARRDRYLGPMIWHVEGTSEFVDALGLRIKRARHVVASSSSAESDVSAAWAPRVFVRQWRCEEDRAAPVDLPPGVTTVLVTTNVAGAIHAAEHDWDLCIGLEDAPEPPNLGTRESRNPGTPELRNLLTASSTDTLFRAIDIKAKTAQVNQIAELTPSAPGLVASVVICTNRDVARLSQTLEAVMSQEFPAFDATQAAPRTSRGTHFEVIVIDNAARDLSAFQELTNRWAGRLRIVPCLLPGLSAARNTGIGAARGDYVCFLDDDAVPAPTWLAAITKAFSEHPEAAVIGGPLLLTPPTPVPSAFNPGWQSYFGHFPVDGHGYREAASWREYPWGANWAARRSALVEIGGFLLSFGRKAGDFGGGEEHIAAARLAHRGHRIGIAGDAIVYHHVAAERFTEEHVRQTMIARYITAWRASQELGLSGHSAILRTAARLAFHHIDPRVKSLRWLSKDFMFRKQAQWRLLAAQWNDLRESLRRAPDATFGAKFGAQFGAKFVQK